MQIYFTTAFLSVFQITLFESNNRRFVLIGHLVAGSSFASENRNKMSRKNQYLLLPHVPVRERGKSNPSNSTFNSNETSESSDLSVDPQNIVNQNFLMESHNNENHIAMMNENDENYFEIFKAPMKFGTENNTEVTAQIGTTAHLPCTIHSIGEGVVSCNCNLMFAEFSFEFFSLTRKVFFTSKSFHSLFFPLQTTRFQVSWIRRKDYHLLTVGLTTYSSDERFSATHLKNSEVGNSCLLICFLPVSKLNNC